MKKKGIIFLLIASLVFLPTGNSPIIGLEFPLTVSGDSAVRGGTTPVAADENDSAPTFAADTASADETDTAEAAVKIIAVIIIIIIVICVISYITDAENK
jgi:hypothetical protein